VFQKVSQRRVQILDQTYDAVLTETERDAPLTVDSRFNRSARSDAETVAGKVLRVLDEELGTRPEEPVSRP
jgi:hypothetical protein